MKGLATEIILTVGILIAVGLSLVQVRSIFVSQEKLSEKEVVVEFSKDLENIINKALSATGDVAFIYIPPITKYKLEIRDNIVRIKDKISGYEASFVVYSSQIVENSFEDSENITVIKKEGKIYVLGRCLKEWERCTSSLSCCRENPYCWGERKNEFFCRRDCAPNGNYAADPEACCSGYLNKTSGKCEEAPVCPPQRICEGAPESWKDANGNDCCPPDKPVCSFGHCCPLDKPIWCSRPKDNVPRCMDQDEFKNLCENQFQVLIVALKRNLKEVYSEEQIHALERKIKEYMNSLEKDGLSSIFLYLDEKETSDLIGVKVTAPHNWKNIDGVLDQLIPKIQANYLIIIGGYRSFPQAELDATCADPYFRKFQTDDEYADYDKDHMPDIPVGRIPDPNGGDINLLLTTLSNYIQLHNSGGLNLSDYFSIIMERAWPQLGCPKASTGICFNKDAFGIKCFSERCRDSTEPYTSISGHEFFNLLMHGSPGIPQVFSDDFCNKGKLFMTSRQVPNLNVKNSVWLMMPCYSSFIKNKQRTQDSIPLQFFKNGGAVYFGGTLTQFGGIMKGSCPSERGGVIGGDCCIGTLYTLFVKNIKVGRRIGDSYLLAKKEYNSIGCRCENSACHFRQLHENLMYGDPTLKIKEI